jgi:hypothetical protein
MSDLNVFINNITALSSTELDQVRIKLTDKINHLLKTDYTQLLNIVYRIDINEAKFNEALLTNNPALTIANLIIERQIQKYFSRIKNA